MYTSYFIVPFALAGALWIRDRAAFLRFTRRLVTLALAGLATYIAFPAAPPWMAGETGLLDGVQRTTSEGWEVLGGGTAGLFSEGQTSVNLVAAVPSLHSAFTALVAMFLWGRVRPILRPLVVLYPLAMGLTLIATGEHYFFDVALGWLYAGAVMGAWAWCGAPPRDRPRADGLKTPEGATKSTRRRGGAARADRQPWPTIARRRSGEVASRRVAVSSVTQVPGPSCAGPFSRLSSPAST